MWYVLTFTDSCTKEKSIPFVYPLRKQILKRERIDGGGPLN